MIRCFLIVFVCLMSFTQAYGIEVSLKEQARIADLIFKNECNRKFECLVSWNDGEDFASLGIGHFIWFPKGSNAPFKESFPDLMRWYEQHHVSIPESLADILSPDQDCPWASKQEFLKDKHAEQIQALRQFLANTKATQASFIIQRLANALPKMLAVTSSEQEKQHIQAQFERVSNSPNGWYALIDYVNFKGEGIKESERYQGKGWGLAQVLLHMQGHQVGQQTMKSFTQAATFVLERRVNLSPPQRNEQRWLAGWGKRLQTYEID
ncbi:MAG: hypothetical protein Q9M44_07835 [Ghiorsea sp.]|nr:hypothetical protein [Ghiorsea sp.]